MSDLGHWRVRASLECSPATERMRSFGLVVLTCKQSPSGRYAVELRSERLMRKSDLLNVLRYLGITPRKESETMPDPTTKLSSVFETQKETENTIRYKEQETEAPPLMGQVYVQKWALRKLNGGQVPAKIRVTVEVVS